MNDLIRREDALRELLSGHDDVIYIDKNEAAKRIRNIPIVEPKQGKWIPCSERLPEKADIYLCTVRAPYRNPREMRYAPQEWADKSDNATWRSTDGSYVYDWFVKAWQPLPKPWKGADDE